MSDEEGSQPPKGEVPAPLLAELIALTITLGVSSSRFSSY